MRAGEPPGRREPVEAKWEALGTSVVLRLGGHGNADEHGAPAEPSASGEGLAPDERPTSGSALVLARAAVERELERIDRACSRFREDSELARVNAGAGRWVLVDPLLIEALTVALRAAEVTAGDVDPTLGVALELAGYDRDWRLLAPAASSEPTPRFATGPPLLAARLTTVRARPRAGWRMVALDRARSAVRVPPGVKLDLGATAKAWAADRAATAAASAARRGALVSLGGDIATRGPSPPEGWRIRVTDDHRSAPSAPGQTISIASGGLATSSTAVRRWHHEGRDMHHIIDPATGTPVRETWRTVSVAAASCTDANIATTAALVRARGAPAWLARQRLPGRFVDWEGNVLRIGGWPAGPDAPTDRGAPADLDAHANLNAHADLEAPADPDAPMNLDASSEEVRTR
jgi:thiamine biosynthesis lipoprotein